MTSRTRRRNSPIDVQTGQEYWILGVGHVGKDDSLRCWNVHAIFSDHMLTSWAPVWRMSAPVWGRISTGEFYSGHWLGVPLHTGSPYIDCTVTTITVHLYCTLVTAYKLPALTTECRSYSLSVCTLFLILCCPQSHMVQYIHKERIQKKKTVEILLLGGGGVIYSNSFACASVMCYLPS